MTGTIKKKTDRGFGFIAMQGEDKDLFFHSSALTGVAFDQLSEGATVSFEVETGPDGRQKAVNVSLADGGAQSAPAEEVAPVEESAPVAEDATEAEESTPAEAAPAEEEAVSEEVAPAAEEDEKA